MTEKLWKDFIVMTEGAAFLETFDLSPDVNIFVFCRRSWENRQIVHTCVLTSW